MDDLAGLDWSTAPSAKKPQHPSYTCNTSAFAALKPTPPASGRVTPLNSSQPSSKPATPANDSFSNLISFSNSTSTANLSLQEQQKKLADLRLQQEKKETLSLQDQYAIRDDSIWNNLGSGRSTPAIESQRNNRPLSKLVIEDEDDIFATFNASLTTPQKPLETKARPAEEDDDPFELAKVRPGRTVTADSSTNGFDNDDVLGLLGGPVSARREPEPLDDPAPTLSNDANPQDRAVAELVDMGFPADKARNALDTTPSGTDIQAAVGRLLNQAHQEASERSQGREPGYNAHAPVAGSRRRGSGGRAPGRQRWQDEHLDDFEPQGKRQRSSSRAAEKDSAQLTTEFGNNLFKTANSLWKQGTKKVQQAVQEFNSDSESNQPKWMREPDRIAKAETRAQQRGDESGTARRRRRSSASQTKEQQSVTDEAMMLEGQRPTPPPRPSQRSRQEPRFDSSADNSRDHSPAIPSRLRASHSPQPAFLRQQPAQAQKTPPQPLMPNARAALSKQANEDQAAQAYVSSARRRKPSSQMPVPASEPDLLQGSSKAQLPPRSPSSRESRPASSTKPVPIAVRPPAPTRNIPPISAISLKASHSHREKGNEHFKRGDYSSAHRSYTTSISHLPSTHPLVIVLMTNRALTGLKIGEPRTTVSDSDIAISLIGVSKGESEQIDFSNGEPPKPMREYYGKALMRKAEALEQMEKWAEAAAAWREAVEGNHGGATSIQGRLRAEKAATPQTQKPKRKPSVAKKPPIRNPPGSSSVAKDSAAVSALRAANVAAEKQDDEKFALSDAVDARINNWKNGKQDNLRALLGSLDTVLWEGSGWKKISMADLVLPGKVKVQYMKGIGRVHPDKIPTDATTEQRMISSAVFSTLNEAWDKFRRENGL